jgi:hypothetical protein
MSKCTTVSVGDTELLIHEVDGSFVISDQGGWLPGSFDSHESAIAGFKFLESNQWNLTDRLRDINDCKKGNRAITIGDITA